MSDHPEERLGRYPDLLDEQEIAEVELHLAGCERCRQQAERLQQIRNAGDDLSRASIEPSEDLDHRALSRIRAEARSHVQRPLWWKATVVAVPVALAAAVVLAVVLRPPDASHLLDDPWTVKGPGELSEDATLQVALVDGQTAHPLSQGAHVPVGATLLVGGTVPIGRSATVYLVQGELRTTVWQGVGNAATAAGAALRTDGKPATAQAPAAGPFQLEIWLDDQEAAPDSTPADRFGLVAERGE